MGWLKKAVSVAAPIVGGAIGGPVGTQIGSAIGSAIAGDQYSRQVGESAAAYDARMRALGQRGYFRPVDTQTYFAKSEFEIDPNTGAVKSASYTPTEAVQEKQRRLEGLSETGLDVAEQAAEFGQQFFDPAQVAFNLGQSFLGESPEQIRQRYMQQQMDVLRPYDIEQEQRLGAGVFGRGASGLSVGVGGNPYLQTYLESQNRRNLQLAAQSEQAARDQIDYGISTLGKAGGLLGTGFDVMTGAMSPYEQYLNNLITLDEQAREALQTGVDIGKAATQGSQFAADREALGAETTLKAELGEAERENEIIQGILENEKVINKGIDIVKDVAGGVKDVVGGGLLSDAAQPPGGGYFGENIISDPMDYYLKDVEKYGFAY